MKLKLGLALLLLFCGCNKVPDTDTDNDPVDPKDKGKLTFVILDDIANRNPSNSAAINDNTLWLQLIADGFNRKIVSTSQTEVAKVYLDRAEQKKITLPALFLVNEKSGNILVSESLKDSGQVKAIAEKYTPKSERGPPLPVYTEPDTGIERRLGMIPADEAALKKRAMMTPFVQGLKARGAGLIPRDQWKTVEYNQFHKPEFVLNQQSTSGCVGYAYGGATMKIRWLQGHPFERLAGNYAYSGINGGSDNGAMILDVKIFGEKYGICREEEFPLPNIYWKQVPQRAKDSALTRQMILSYPVDTEEEMATALQLGMIVEAGVQVDGNFGRFDSNGISFANGRYANHAIHIYGMKQVDGEWVYYMGNSWGATWGPWRNGSCLLRIKGIVLRGDAFVLADSEWNPNNLPTPKRGNEYEKSDNRFVLAP